MDYLVVYDISFSETRNKVMNILIRYGYHIGYSTFYLENIKQKDLQLIVQEIEKVIDQYTDRVFFYPVEKIEAFYGFPLEPWKLFVL